MAKNTKVKKATRKPSLPKTKTEFIAFGYDQYGAFIASAGDTAADAAAELKNYWDTAAKVLGVLELKVPLPKEEKVIYKTIKVTVKEQ